MLIFAYNDGCSIVLLLVVLGGLGQLLVRATERMRREEQRIYHWACWFGVLTGVLMAGQELLDAGSFDAEEVVGVIFLGALTGLFSAFGWYFVFALIVFLWQHVIAVPFRLLSRYSAAAQRRAAQRQQTLDEQRRSAERARVSREAEARSRTEGERKSQEQKRREDARFACQMLYDRHQATLANVFPRQQLDAYFERYLADRHSAEEVELRAAELKEMIQEFAALGEPTGRRFNSLAEVFNHFENERAAIEKSHGSDETKRALLAELARDQARAIRDYQQT